MNLDLYQNKRVLVTGGASFIGSHLVDLLVDSGAIVTVVDDLSSGRLENLSQSIEKVSLVRGNIGTKGEFSSIYKESEIVFHLAAIHGGRGFIEKYPQRILENLSIDNVVFSECMSSSVKRVVHASSACAYPIELQSSKTILNQLHEEQANFTNAGGAFPDGAYGWTKLMGEYQLEQFCRQSDMTGRSARIFTAYGSRENESHAAVALLAKALLKIDPYPVWGDGRQTRNFTHVSDTVMGLALLGLDLSSEHFSTLNVGTSEHNTVMDLLEIIFSLIEWNPTDFYFQLNKPTGVSSRSSNNEKIKEIFGWEPNVDLEKGVREMYEWYVVEKFPGLTESALHELLDSR